jgi:hypothetical protein
VPEGRAVSSDAAALIEARRSPDFSAWSQTLVFVPDAAEPGRVGVAATADDQADLAIGEICFALRLGRSGPSVTDGFAHLLELSAKIARGELPHPDARWIGREFDRFDAQILAVAGASFGRTTHALAPGRDSEAALAAWRTCAHEYLRNLWTWLRERRRLPLITPDRAAALVAHACQAAHDDRLPTTRAAIDILAESLFAEEAMEVIDAVGRRNVEVDWLIPETARLATLMADDEKMVQILDRLDEAGLADEPSLAPRRLSLLNNVGRMSEGKKFFLSRWKRHCHDAGWLAVGLSLDWSDAERLELRELLMRLVEAADAPKLAADAAFAQLVAWGYGREAAEAVRRRGEASLSRLGLLSEAVSRGLFPPLPHGEAMPRFDRNVIVHPRPGSDTAIIMFDSVRAGSVPIELMHCLLSRPSTNLIYLRDAQRNLCLGGIRELGATYADTVKALGALLKNLQVRHVHTFAISGGALAAIRYGVDLGADSVLAFGAATNITAEFLAKDRRRSMLAKRLRGIIPERDHDLREVLLRHRTRPRIVLRYGGYDKDVRHAHHLADVPGVELRPIEDWPGHDAVKALVMRGGFEKELREIVEMTKFVDVSALSGEGRRFRMAV